MYNATAFNHAYTDSGLFCIYSSAHPSQLRELCDVIVRELTAMAGTMDVVELEGRARGVGMWTWVGSVMLWMWVRWMGVDGNVSVEL